MSDGRKDIPKLVHFPKCVSQLLLPVFIRKSNPAQGWPYWFRSRRTTGSTIAFKFFGLRLGGNRIHMCGHSVSGNLINLGDSAKFTCVYAEKPRRWFLLSDQEVWNVCIQTFCCRLDVPCSANTAWYPSLLVTFSSQSATLPLYFWRCFGRSACFNWQRSMGDANEQLFRHLPPAFGFTFLNAQADKLLSLSLSLYTAAVGCWNFHRFFNCDGFVYQAVMEFRHLFSLWYSFTFFAVADDRRIRFPCALEKRHSCKFPRARLFLKYTAFERTMHFPVSSRASEIT